jgi:serine/threonine protein kinase
MSKPIHFEANISEASRDFIRRCLRVKEEDRLGWEEAFNHGLLRPEKRKGIMGGAVVGAMEEDKENINVNILGRESRSLKMRRDVSENKIKMPMQNIKTPKTPTRSRLTQILALTPSREGQGERPSFVKKPNFNKTESSLNIRPRFK